MTELQVYTEQPVQALSAAQRRTEERVTELVAAQRHTEEQIAAGAAQMADLIQVVRTFATDLAELKGKSLEGEYRTKVHAYFSRIVRRAHMLSQDELTALLEDAIDRGALSEEQAADVSLADVIVRGRRRSDGAEVFLVVEVSWGVGPQDVERALRRAALLAHAGSPVLPVVAGTWVTPEAADLARAASLATDEWAYYTPRVRRQRRIPPSGPSSCTALWIAVSVASILWAKPS